MSQPTNERWLPVVGYEKYYAVSDHGRVRSLDRTVYLKNGRTRFQPGRVLKQWKQRNGYHSVSLYGDSGETRHLVHRLVLTAFVGCGPADSEACHNNGEPSDNRLSNLRWDTHTENVRDVVRHGNHWQVAKTHCPQGHEYTEDNIYRRPGYPAARYCKTCKAEYMRMYWARKKEAS